MEKMKKIFIVDDDIFIHEAINAVLSSDEFEIIHAYDGQGIVELIEKEQPDLVVLDINMPIKDGRDICRDLKKDPKTKDVKILMFSGNNRQLDRIQALKLGADDYETKPLSPSLLVSKIKKMCGIKRLATHS